MDHLKRKYFIKRFKKNFASHEVLGRGIGPDDSAVVVADHNGLASPFQDGARKPFRANDVFLALLFSQIGRRNARTGSSSSSTRFMDT